MSFLITLVESSPDDPDDTRRGEYELAWEYFDTDSLIGLPDLEDEEFMQEYNERMIPYDTPPDHCPVMVPRLPTMPPAPSGGRP